MADWKKTLLASGLVGGIVLGGLAGCGDGVDQDNGVDDGEEMDDVDEENKNPEEEGEE
ncbi:hypothetical protein M9R32_10310 [Paenisporosarcina quisquiliarum]|jgi:hypothetical protein|uniref:Uncharacterized protein n=1 Tax=Paenisporosarcina quisquiliarum TaxID=365346 RepID=A0A9X3LI83_9BACL|nr:hypothetical protein [Paenisporosarcina quisquiliarum]MCZ8537574.1 hypothetical protein [Paenisporosarcina quisquiliarum]